MSFVNKEAARYSGEAITFSFGQNWSKFLQLMNEDRIAWACRSIQTITGLSTLAGRRFLDVGCGSGLFSLAACRLGADLVVSLDIDPHSLECATRLRLREGAPSNWMIVRASALAMPVRECSFDFVYSWGVLHHTGSMWPAIEMVSRLVKKKGLFYLAIYREERFSKQWLSIKRFYNRRNTWVKQWMVYGYAAFSIAHILRSGRNPWRVIRDYGRAGRGMSWFRDIEDWLGGLPYEYCRPESLIDFLKSRGFDCLHKPIDEEMEYLFVRSLPVLTNSSSA